MRRVATDRFLLAGVLTLLGCAETKAIQETPPPVAVAVTPGPPRPSYRPGEMPVGPPDEPTEAVGVNLERGVLNQAQVNEVLAQHATRLGACYGQAGRAQQFAHGEVRLRFQVEASGEVREVLVIGNELGSYPVERCLVSEGRKIRFPSPDGGKESDFEYSMQFRAPRQKHVVIARRGALRRPSAARMRSLGRCGSPGEQAVQAIAYVKPNGWVGSVGLASEGPLEADAARCVVGKILRWRLPAYRGHVVRTSFAVSRGRPATEAAESASPLGPTARLKRVSPRRMGRD